MKKQILDFLGDFIPANVSLASIAKLNPSMASFFSAATTAGYAADQIKSYLKTMTGEPSGRKQRREELGRQSNSQGMRQDQIREKTQLDEQVQDRPNISPSAIGGLAGLASQLGQQPGQPDQTDQQPSQDITELDQQLDPQAEIDQQQERTPNFFQRAMEGVDFFDLDDTAKPKVASLKKMIDNLETQGAPWEDKSVQKIVKALRRSAGKGGIVAQEAKRFAQGAMKGAPQQGSNIDSQLSALISSLTQKYNQ